VRGRLVLLYLPTYSPLLNPIEMLRRQFRREVTHCELFATVNALLAATHDFFDRHNQQPNAVLSIIGSRATQLIRNPSRWLYFAMWLMPLNSGLGLDRLQSPTRS
jgi:hypothetical protein